MIYAFSLDGINIDEVAEVLPANAWVDTSEFGVIQGHFVALTEANKTDHNWYAFDNAVPQPDADHVRSTDRVGDGFAHVWTFDLDTQAANAVAAIRRSKSDAVDNSIAALRQWALDAAALDGNVTSANAVVVLQEVVDRLGVFFDRFADLRESQR